MGYTNSSMVAYTKLSPNHSGQRTMAIDRITPHCVVGQCTAEGLGDWFAKSSTQASSNYGIDKDGRVGMYVEEKNRSWCSSSSANDQRAVTIECASDTTEPYAFRDIVYQRLIELCVDICKRNGKTKLLWLTDKDKTLNYQPKADEMILTVHRWFANKSCPGNWMFARMGDLAEKVTAALGGEADVPSTDVPVPEPVNDPEKTIWLYLMGKIGNAFGVAGLMGNLYAESGLLANNLQNSFEKKLGLSDDNYTLAVDSGAYGNFVKDKAGYLYPACEQAAVVSDLLRLKIESLKIKVVTECKVKEVRMTKKGFAIQAGDQKFTFDRVILACGSKAAPKTGSDGSGYDIAKALGHRMVPVVPALTGLKCKETFFKAVSGVRADALISLIPNDDPNRETCRGELQLTDYGISGIPVFQLSRYANYRLRKDKEVPVVIDFLPDIPMEQWMEMAKVRRMLSPDDVTVEGFFTGILNKKLMMLFIKNSGLKPDMILEKAQDTKLDQVFRQCKEWKVTVNGVSMEGITKDLESEICPGLFFAGELLDVDGLCGGYNLQWAWSSGFVTGKMAATD